MSHIHHTLIIWHSILSYACLFFFWTTLFTFRIQKIHRIAGISYSIATLLNGISSIIISGLVYLNHSLTFLIDKTIYLFSASMLYLAALELAIRMLDLRPSKYDSIFDRGINIIFFSLAGFFMFMMRDSHLITHKLILFFTFTTLLLFYLELKKDIWAGKLTAKKKKKYHIIFFIYTGIILHVALMSILIYKGYANSDPRILIPLTVGLCAAILIHIKMKNE